jgi:hypothetical protein
MQNRAFQARLSGVEKTMMGIKRHSWVVYVACMRSFCFKKKFRLQIFRLHRTGIYQTCIRWLLNMRDRHIVNIEYIHIYMYIYIYTEHTHIYKYICTMIYIYIYIYIVIGYKNPSE